MSVFIGLAVAKSKAAKSGEVNEERRALYDDAWLFYISCFVIRSSHFNSRAKCRLRSAGTIIPRQRRSIGLA
jgi:hypothetical protein